MGALGRRGHRQHKNKTSRGHLVGSHRSGFGPYGRGNFPGHHVFGWLTKSGVDGCRCSQSGLDGRGWRNTAKIIPNG